MGNLSQRPLKQVTPGGVVSGGGWLASPAGPRWQTELQTSRSLSSGSCSAFLFTPFLTTRGCPPRNPSQHQRQRVAHCPSVFSDEATRLIGSSFNTASRCKTAAL